MTTLEVRDAIQNVILHEEKVGPITNKTTLIELKDDCPQVSTAEELKQRMNALKIEMCKIEVRLKELTSDQGAKVIPKTPKNQ